jgi:FkbM family methyltransferase
MIGYFGDGLPHVFIDIGANLGQTIVEAFSVRRWKTYYALEPNPDVCAYLEALVNLNGLPVQILPWASGRMATPHRFSLQGRNDASATLAPEGRPGVYSSEMSRWVATILWIRCSI